MYSFPPFLIENHTTTSPNTLFSLPYPSLLHYTSLSPVPPLTENLIFLLLPLLFNTLPYSYLFVPLPYRQPNIPFSTLSPLASIPPLLSESSFSSLHPCFHTLLYKSLLFILIYFLFFQIIPVTASYSSHSLLLPIVYAKNTPSNLFLPIATPCTSSSPSLLCLWLLFVIKFPHLSPSSPSLIHLSLLILLLLMSPPSSSIPLPASCH